MNSDPSVGEVHSILSSQERRAVISHLAASDGSVTVSDLVAVVSDRSERARDRDGGAHLRLYHTHLPKLEESGVVEYDPDTGRVSLTSTGAQVDRIREQTADILDADSG